MRTTKTAYGALSLLLTIAIAAVLLYQGTLSGPCDPSSAIGNLEFALFFGGLILIPVALIGAMAVFAFGYAAKRYALIIEAVILAISVGLLGITALTPHHYLSPNSSECRIDL